MPSIYHSWLSEAEKTAQSDAERQSVLKQLQADYREVFKSETGQRVLADLIRRNRFVQLGMDADPMMLAALRARHDFLLEILNMIVVTPEAAERLITTGETSAVFSGEELAHDDSTR